MDHVLFDGLPRECSLDDYQATRVAFRDGGPVASTPHRRAFRPVPSRSNPDGMTTLMLTFAELCPKNGPLHHLVLENPECLSSPALLPLLMKVEEDPEIHLSVIFLAPSAKDWLPKDAAAAASRTPLSVTLEGYSIEEMISVMEKRFLPFNAHDNISQDFIKSEPIKSERVS